MIVREPFDPDEDGGGHSLYLTQRLPDYGAGRRCPRCGSVLRRSNPGPLCDPCRDQVRAAKLDGQELAPLPGEVPVPVPTRRPELTIEEVTALCDDALGLLRGGRCWTTAELGERMGISRQRVKKLIDRLREAGHEIDSEAGVGTRLVREAPAASAMVCSYRDSDTGETVVAEPAAEATAPMMPPPFAGGWPEGEPMVVGATHSREVHVICELDSLDAVARERVLRYAVATWWMAS